MNVHVLQHVPFEGLGSIAGWLAQRHAVVTHTRFFASACLPAVSGLDLLIVLGGPMGVHDEDRFPWLAEEKRFVRRCIDTGVAVLGICLGAQLIAAALDAPVFANAEKEIGWFPVEMLPAAAASDVFTGFPDRLEVFHWHGDTFGLPEKAGHISRSSACAHQAFVVHERVVGLQFHLETTDASLQQLISHCSAEIVPGAFIQAAETMAADARRFAGINALMHRLLDNMAAVIDTVGSTNEQACSQADPNI